MDVLFAFNKNHSVSDKRSWTGRWVVFGRWVWCGCVPKEVLDGRRNGEGLSLSVVGVVSFTRRGEKSGRVTRGRTFQTTETKV